MHNSSKEIVYAKCLNGTASAEERSELLQWLALPENETRAKEWLLSTILDNDRSLSMNSNNTDQVLQAIFHTRPAPVAPMRRKKWQLYAAAVLLLIAAATWLLYQQRSTPTVPVTARHEIAPAQQGAILTLADGKQLVLDTLRNGVIAVQNGARVLLEKGRLSYSAGTGNPAAFNTITTPRGRKYDILLADGTHIWLNAASSVSFPANFTGKERRVKITGEAYLEVAKETRPFLVDIDGRSSLQVLGTSFNVKAYAGEPGIQTTLVEGAVKINDHILRPLQQSLQTNNNFAVIDNVDVAPVLAWKNGIFYFNNADLPAVMRELERWYDITVVYQGRVPRRRFAGEIGRDLTLTQVLKGLKNMEVHFEIKEKQILVTE